MHIFYHLRTYTLCIYHLNLYTPVVDKSRMLHLCANKTIFNKVLFIEILELRRSVLQPRVILMKNLRVVLSHNLKTSIIVIFRNHASRVNIWPDVYKSIINHDLSQLHHPLGLLRRPKSNLRGEAHFDQRVVHHLNAQFL